MMLDNFPAVFPVVTEKKYPFPKYEDVDLEVIRAWASQQTTWVLKKIADPASPGFDVASPVHARVRSPRSTRRVRRNTSSYPNSVFARRAVWPDAAIPLSGWFSAYEDCHVGV